MVENKLCGLGVIDLRLSEETDAQNQDEMRVGKTEIKLTNCLGVLAHLLDQEDSLNCQTLTNSLPRP